MKKHMKIVIIAGFFLAGMTQGQAQQVANFEDLNLETESYYDGGADHSGTEMETEVFHYQSGNVHFSVNHTDWGGSNSFGGMAYSNQCDTVTADFTNFSVYANPENTGTYGIYYPSWGVSDSISFGETVNLQSVKIANHTWGYHYMKGTDDSGTGTFSTGDSLTVTFSGYNAENELVKALQTHLADFTNDNSMILDDWTEIDLSEMLGISYLKIAINSSDSWAPSYVCIDDLTYLIETVIHKNSLMDIAIYPNPVVDYVVIENAKGASYIISDMYGKAIENGKLHSDAQQISLENFSSGIYILRLTKNSQTVSKKIIK